MKLHTRNRARRGGFSLAELMVVIVIIGLLAMLVVPNVMKRLGTAQTGRVRADLSTIQSAIEEYQVLNAGRLPESLEELSTPDASGNSFFRNNRVPTDPWNNEYQFERGTGSSDYRIYSLGKDGQIGGDGDDRDLDSIELLGGGAGD